MSVIKVIQRLRDEFTAMPGLQLTAAQAARLCGEDLQTSASALCALVSAGFLAPMPNGGYRRNDTRSRALTPQARAAPRAGREMRISVMEVGTAFGRETRAYAEYRIFSSIARFSGIARHVEVLLTSRAARGSTATCQVAVSVHDGARLIVSARGCHVHAAVNRAACRIADALWQHSGPPSTAARYDGTTR